MISRQSHTSVYVLDQDEALAFYRDTLGFEVRSDMQAENFRWLTVSPKAQREPELILIEPVAGPMFSAEDAKKMRSMIANGNFGIGVFETPDCRATCHELKAKGVKFLREPSDQFYGIEALVKDNSGNWFSLVQRKHGGFK